MALRDDLQPLPDGMGTPYNQLNPNQGSFSVIPGANEGSFGWGEQGSFHSALLQVGRDPNGLNVNWGDPAMARAGTPEHQMVNQFLVVGDSGRVSNVEHFTERIDGTPLNRVVQDGVSRAMSEDVAIGSVSNIPGGLIGFSATPRDIPNWEEHTWQIPVDTPGAWADYIRNIVVDQNTHPYDSTPPLLDLGLSVQGTQDGGMVFGKNVIAVTDAGGVKLFSRDTDGMAWPLTEGERVGGGTQFIPDENWADDYELTRGEMDVSGFAAGAFDAADIVTFQGRDGMHGVAFVPVGIDGTLQALPLNQREGQPVVADADRDGIPDAADKSTLAFSTVDANGMRVQVDHDNDGNPDELQHTPVGAVEIPGLAAGWHPEVSTLGASEGGAYEQAVVSNSGNEQLHFNGGVEITADQVNLAPGTEMTQIHAPVMGSDAPDALEGHAVGIPDGHGFTLEATSGSYTVTGREITADGILGEEVNVTVNAGEVREFGPMVGGVAAANGTGGVFKVNEEGVAVPAEQAPDAGLPPDAALPDAAVPDAELPDAQGAGGQGGAGGNGGAEHIGGQGGQAAGGAEGGAGGNGGAEQIGGNGGQGGMEAPGGAGGEGGVVVMPPQCERQGEEICNGIDDDCDGFTDNNETGHEAPPLQGEEVITCMGLNGETMEIRLQTECDTTPNGNHEMLVMMRVDGQMVPMNEIDRERMCQEEMGQGGAGGDGGAGGEAMGGSAGEGGVSGTIPEGGSGGEPGNGGTPGEGGGAGEPAAGGEGGMAVVPGETGGTAEVGGTEKSGGRAGEGGASTEQQQKGGGGGCDIGVAGHGAGMGLNAALMMAVAAARLWRGNGRRR